MLPPTSILLLFALVTLSTALEAPSLPTTRTDMVSNPGHGSSGTISGPKAQTVAPNTTNTSNTTGQTSTTTAAPSTSPSTATPTTSASSTSAKSTPPTAPEVTTPFKLPLESANTSEVAVTNATESATTAPASVTSASPGASTVPSASQEALQATETTGGNNTGTTGDKNFAHHFSPSTTNGLITLLSLHFFASVNLIAF